MKCFARLAVAAATGLLVPLGGALAREQPVVVTTEDDPACWTAKPTGADIERCFPSTGRAKGGAIVRCKVDVQGPLTGCEVIDEYPLHEGFGDASLNLMPKFRMTRTTKSGRSTEGLSVNVPVLWTMQ